MIGKHSGHYQQVWDIINLYNDILCQGVPTLLPTFIIWGKEDKIYDIRGANRLYALAYYIAHFQEAVHIQDSLRYAEPPSWYYPVRQSLGAALLQAGRAEAAEAVYRQDLKQY